MEKAKEFWIENPQESFAVLSKVFEIPVKALSEYAGVFELGVSKPSDSLEAVSVIGTWIHSALENFKTLAVPDYRRVLDDAIYLDSTGESNKPEKTRVLLKSVPNSKPVL